MDIIILILQAIIAIGIFNVWILRFGKATEWRGGTAKNMREEFSAYGLPVWFMYLIGALKLLLAVVLVIGIWVPGLAQSAALGMAVLMVGAIIMHVKVKDPLKRSLPAFTMLIFSLVIYFGH